jgi:hypothetical protein
VGFVVHRPRVVDRENAFPFPAKLQEPFVDTGVGGGWGGCGCGGRRGNCWRRSWS